MGLPARLSLAFLPTPLQAAPRLSAELGVELLFKRDDLTGGELSGNKIRKLEFLLAEARADGADTVVTCGGVQSNHCRATALAAARLGLRAVLLLRVPEPGAPPPLGANSLLDRLAGAELRYVSVEEYRRRAALFVEVADALRAAGRKPYLIPEGGSNATGSCGYVAAMHELRSQLGPGPVTIAYAVGSGGTAAGVEMGLRHLGWQEARAVGFAVCDDRAFFQRVAAGISDEAAARYGLPRLEAASIDVRDDTVGPGYARTTPEMLGAIRDLARAEGIVTDPVYTGKAFFGVREALRRDRQAFGPRVVFLHTGGVFGLFPFAAELAAVLDG